MTRWKLTIEYDGSGFCGWQRQTHAPSVQQCIEEAFHKFCGEEVALHVAGRTDTGVHARAQVAHVDLVKETNADTVRDAVNFYLRPNKISILAVEAVDESFHARFSALGRVYRYSILNRRPQPALLEGRVWHVQRPLDCAAMQQAADLLIGQHDFSTFRAQNCQAKSPIKTLDLLRIEREDEMIVISTAARSFLYHQVRNMVGTLAMVGSGQWSLETFHDAFKACDRRRGGPTAPAHGLVFWSVSYPQK